MAVQKEMVSFLNKMHSSKNKVGTQGGVTLYSTAATTHTTITEHTAHKHITQSASHCHAVPFTAVLCITLDYHFHLHSHFWFTLCNTTQFRARQYNTVQDSTTYNVAQYNTTHIIQHIRNYSTPIMVNVDRMNTSVRKVQIGFFCIIRILCVVTRLVGALTFSALTATRAMCGALYAVVCLGRPASMLQCLGLAGALISLSVYDHVKTDKEQQQRRRRRGCHDVEDGR